MLEVEHFSVTIICGVNLLRFRISIQYGLSHLNTVIFYQFARNTNSLTVLERMQFCFRVGMQLLENVLPLSSLDYSLSSKACAVPSGCTLGRSPLTVAK